jgi:arylsulfatase A-like enzyme
MVRWPGRIKPGEISTEIVSGLDWFPTLLAVAGDTSVKERSSSHSTCWTSGRLVHAFLAVPTQQFVARFLATFKEFPPRQKAASFSIDQVIERLQQQGAGK